MSIDKLVERANRVSRALITTDDPTVIDELLDALASARAENLRLREALEPFAAVLDEFDPDDEDDETPGTFVAGSVTDYSLTLGDFRRAACVLSALVRP